MKNWILILVCFLLCSCSAKKANIEKLIDLNKTERLELLYLFDDLYNSASCPERQELIESNKTLQAFGRQYKLPTGYLFDIFSYTEKFKSQSIERELYSAVLNVWETVSSTGVIKDIMEEVDGCYPEEYLKGYKKSKTSSRRSSSSRSSSSRSSSSRSSSSKAVCDRTPEIRDRIVALIKSHCSGITITDLESIVDEDGDKVFDQLSEISSGTLKTYDFFGFSSILLLDLSYKTLNSLPSGIFDSLSSLEKLYLNNNYLRSLPSGIFDRLSSLKLLDLLNNDFRSLPSGIFNRLSSLEELYLSNNPLNSLSSSIFNSLSSLEKLYLSNTDLGSLPSGIFDNLSSLEKLYLSNTDLSSLPSGIFDNLSSLEVLDINNNALNSLPSDIFDNLNSLRILNLSYNDFSNDGLPANIFNNLSSLEELDLRNTGLSINEKQRVRTEISNLGNSITLKI